MMTPRRSKALFYPLWTTPPHFETDLELVQIELDRGNEVFMVDCNRDLQICDNNLDWKSKRCSDCIRWRRTALNLFPRQSVTTVRLGKYLNATSVHPFPTDTIDTVADLKGLTYENYDVGYSIAASMADDLDGFSFERCKAKVLKLYSAGVGFFLAVRSIIEEYDIDHGYIFNGRFCLSRAFFRAFEKENLPVFTHDRGSSFRKYSINRNALPHDIGDYTRRVEGFWNSNPDIAFKEGKARDYFADRMDGKETDFISFTAAQVPRKLPEQYLEYKKRIAIFNSSSFEYDYIGPEYSYKFYKSQSDAIKRICEEFSNDGDTGIFLREHPNLRGLKNSQRMDVRRIDVTNFHVVDAESDISSYDMLLQASVVVTFTSTVGIEATYWGIPSILCANAIYQNLKIAYQPSSHEELICLLRTDLKPIDKLDATKYGYYHGYSGIDYVYYEPTSLFGGTFRGRELYASSISRLVREMRGRFKKAIKTVLRWT